MKTELFTTHDHNKGEMTCDFGKGKKVVVNFNNEVATKFENNMEIGHFDIKGMNVDVFHRELIEFSNE